MATAISLEEYKIAEVEVFHEEARKSFLVHLLIYVGVNVLTTLFNLLVADDEIWFVYPLIGWGLGLTFHYFAGVRAIRSQAVKRQARVEQRALENRPS